MLTTTFAAAAGTGGILPVSMLLGALFCVAVHLSSPVLSNFIYARTMIEDATRYVVKISGPDTVQSHSHTLRDAGERVLANRLKELATQLEDLLEEQRTNRREPLVTYEKAKICREILKIKGTAERIKARNERQRRENGEMTLYDLVHDAD